MPPVCLYRTYRPSVRHFWSRGGPRAARKRKPAHLKFKGHMRWRYGCVANASLAVTISVFTVKIALVTTVFITTVFRQSTMENEERPRSPITESRRTRQRWRELRPGSCTVHNFAHARPIMPSILLVINPRARMRSEGLL